ncbi:ABC transporter permease [Roseibium sp. SCP14]|uniref:ABC transporter permease n=1 Tax=Roseibium sp. SCP14 TaxID=3141375 RepID=UPI00333DD613
MTMSSISSLNNSQYIGDDEQLAEKRQRRQLVGLLTPGAVWLFAFLLLPMFVLLAMSFNSYIDAQIINEFTLENYRRIFTEPVYGKVVLRSFTIAITVTAVTLLLGYPVAHFIARKTSKYKDLLFLALIIPFWTSIVIRTYAWKILLGNSGMVNYLLREAGLIDLPVQFLFSTSAVVVGLVHVFLPFMIMPLYASLDKLDPSLEEAASDLGANRIRTFLRVTLPLTLPGVAMGSLLVFILALGSFLTPDLLGGTNTLMISNVIQAEFLESGNWPFGGAMAVSFLCLSLVFIFSYNRLFRFDQ